MALADRPDGTMPVSPIRAVNEDGGYKDLIVSRRGDLYVVSNTPQPFDHQGHVVWHDDCQAAPFRYTTTPTGAASDAEVSEEAAYTGAYSIKLSCGPSTGNNVTLTRGLPALVSGCIGVELDLAFKQFAHGCVAAGIWLLYYSGDKLYTFGLRYRDITTFGTDVWKTTGWEEQATDRARCAIHSWNALKLVVDLDNQEYVRGLLDGYAYDLSAITVPRAGNTDPKGLDLVIQVTAMEDSSEYCYLGRVLVTDFEPPSGAYHAEID